MTCLLHCLSNAPSYYLLLQREEESTLAKSMMSKKTKRLYGRMQHGIEEKTAAIRALEGKREAFENTTSSGSSGSATKAKQTKGKK